jgi:hypothetical protein
MTEFSGNTISKQVRQYVADNPRCLKSEIMRDLGIIRNTASGTLNRLRAAGHVRCIQDTVDVDGKKFPVTRWEIGTDPDVILKDSTEGAPRRRFLKEWTAHVEADQLFTLFFNKHNKENAKDETAYAL